MRTPADTTPDDSVAVRGWRIDDQAIAGLTAAAALGRCQAVPRCDRIAPSSRGHARFRLPAGKATWTAMIVVSRGDCSASAGLRRASQMAGISEHLATCEETAARSTPRL
ncbi:hypothetical protein GCM10010109_64400 [Actinoplanes campanulatus]|nr:hypothetical protein GCM10010109_64400 [Actinoplanes campanulatus]GID39714.1 hypothetical protein Aca09nite_62200 [Actinoplanes campanulatus]